MDNSDLNKRDRDELPITERSRPDQPHRAPGQWHAPQISMLAFSFTAMAGTSGLLFDSTINYS